MSAPADELPTAAPPGESLWGKIWRHVRSSSVFGRLLKGSAWSLLGTSMSRLASIVSTILLARLIGQQHFGEFGIIQNTIGMFGVFAGFGLGLTGSKHVAELRQTDPERARRVIALTLRIALAAAVLLSALLLALAGPVARVTLDAPHLESLLRLAMPMLFLQALIGAQTGVLAGLEAFRRIFHITTLAGITGAALLVLGAWSKGLAGAVVATGAGFALTALLNAIGMRRETQRYNIPAHARHPWREIGLVWSFSLPAMLSNVSIVIAMWAASVLLVNSPNGYNEMGVYTAAGQWFNAMILIPNLIGQVALPILSERRGAKDTRNFQRLWLGSVAMNLALVVPLFLGGALLSRPIMAAYGAGFADDHWTLVLTLLAGALHAVLNALAQIFVQANRMWLVSALTLGWSLVFLGAAAILVDYGAWGLALARVIAFAAHALWVGWFAWRQTRAEIVIAS